MNAGKNALVDVAKLEKMLLAKQVGQFLCGDHNAEERTTVEAAARKLAEDVCRYVRETLAFELRKCDDLAPDLAEKIARDIEPVSSPFLEETNAFSTATLIRLIPQLKEYARAAIARRTDLNEDVQEALIKSSSEQGVTNLVRNDRIEMPEKNCSILVRRFQDNVRVMDQFSARNDLPLIIIEKIVNKVSTHCRNMLVETYSIQNVVADELAENTQFEAMWQKVAGATASQIHGYVTDLRDERRLNHPLTIKVANRGCLTFLESALALEAGLPTGRVKEMLSLEDQAAFVRLMQMANVDKKYAPQYLKIAKANYLPEGKKAA
ncbi:DUF2336 domain-containing protein [Kordiimonas sp. SCSIO 12603]|uniref:DUF2336 domain-containing protein n=1 Tax=Kordiimonas sp. SCSIO 12603 TaxID=2829596 RepID=UPI002101FE24|nr:DUF2336 domain-containing protein [Kordiimonas sp. SCSIO 12603]UTW59638.1 DUF2336 domain-containing protein [Kordiimonas sp. SCSIO 12603]